MRMTPEAFQEALPDLIKRGFPPPREISGSFSLEAIDAWRRKGRRKKPTGYIYFIACGDFIKIGYSVDPTRRLADIHSTMPFEATILLAFAGVMKDESKLHKKFAHLRHRNEWFRRDADLLAYIDWMDREGDRLLFLEWWKV